MRDRIDVLVRPSGEGWEWFVDRLVGDWGTVQVAAGWCRTEDIARSESGRVAVRERAKVARVDT